MRILSFLMVFSAVAFGQVEGFPVHFGVSDTLPLWGAPAFVQLDSSTVIVFGSTNDSLYGFSLDGTPAPGFPAYCYGPVRSKVAWFVRRDTVAIVVLAADGNLAEFLWDGENLNPAWQVDLGDSADYISPVVDDIDADGEEEIIAAVDTVLFCVAAEDGAIEWSAEFESSVGRPVATPACGDVDGDGFSEIFVEGYQTLSAFDHTGEALPGFPVELESYEAFSYSAPLLFDYDGDGAYEIFCGAHDITGTNYGLIAAFEPDGSRIDDPFFLVESYGAWVYSQVSWCDANGDYSPDLAFGDVTGGLYAVGTSGEITSFGGTGRGHPGHIYGSVMMCDLDGHAGPEYVFQLMIEDDSLMLLVIMDPGANDLADFPDSVEISATGILSPAIATVGESTYIAALTPDGALYLWGFDGTPLPGYRNWTQLFGDPQNHSVAPPENVAINQVAAVNDTEFQIIWSKSEARYFAKYLLYQSPDSVGDSVSLLAEIDDVDDTSFVLVTDTPAESLWFFVLVEDIWGNTSLRSVPKSPADTTFVAEFNPGEKIFSVYPNPFNSVCRAEIPKGYTVRVYDVRGNRLAELSPSQNEFSGRECPSGVMFFVLTDDAGREVAVRKALLVK